MKVLLSAYACEPGKGSEQGVGWNWAVELKKLNFEVYVLTRSNNKISIEQNEFSKGIKFIYYDLPYRITKFKNIIGIHVYYLLWQYFSYVFLKRKFKKNHFDIVHHLTFVSFRFPTFIYKLGGRFILGPIGGGEEGIKTLVRTLPFKNQFSEKFRLLINRANALNFFINNAYKAASEIYVTTQETFNKIPAKFQYKTKIASAIGIEKKTFLQQHTMQDEFVILYAGNLLHWKGIHLAILAFDKIKDRYSNVVFKIVGSGNFNKYLVALVAQLDLTKRITFTPFVPQADLYKIYQASHLFLFPSFHDSGGLVVLEAMSFGLPVICLNQGGPSVIVGAKSRNVIQVENNCIEQIIKSLADRLDHLIQNPKERIIESELALAGIDKYSWANIVNQIYKENFQ